MIQLERFTAADFDRFISWVDNEEALVQFAGPLFTYPLTHEQLTAYLQQTKKQPFKIRLLETGQVIGHCELNFEKEMPRLSRILIGEKSMRNKGLGKQVVKEMVNRLFSTTEHTAVDLNVFEWNHNAVACYTQLGFRINPDMAGTTKVGEAVWNTYNMVLQKADWLLQQEGPKERYSLEWPGKRAAMAIAGLPATQVLHAVKTDGVNFDGTENIYIEGDNLEVLKLLHQQYTGSIKMIYIDPPYNTGRKFVYHDNFRQSSASYHMLSEQDEAMPDPEASGRYHASWLSMMYPRLKLAGTLLREDGIIFISIDDRELPNLRRICDEIFGEMNFVSCLPRITKKAGKSTSMIARNNDYVLCYRRSPSTRFNTSRFDAAGYVHSDEYEAERGRYKLSQTLDYSSIQYSPSMDYEIEIEGQVLRPGNVTREEMLKRQQRNPKSDFCWRWSKELYEFGRKNGFVVLKRSRNGYRIYTKTYEKATISRAGDRYSVEMKERTKSFSSLDLIDNRFSNDNAKKDMSKLFGEKIFEYSKPVSLIAELIALATDEDDIILDFFSGSATTAHAVYSVAALTGKQRKFILVQEPQPTDEDSEAYHAGYKNICEIGKERIHRAAKAIRTETGAVFDDGFRVYRLGSPANNGL
ncbi:GNAT family N-acetyltransferase [Chitinophaga polysaccharea]|uniref:GNAT family N-acetyltransferase n=1 Tax=Chitinophaga polysaccharea TaxID=1293035 RepID=UPI00115B586E|nr:GNAT family N-acetyltransferase [Chitinophaga polysaccharea]